MRYEKFAIRLGPKQGRSYQVTVLDSPAGQASGSFTVPPDLHPLLGPEHNGSLVRAPAGSGLWRGVALVGYAGETPQAMQKRVGGALFRALIAGEVRSCWDESRGTLRGQEECGLRLQLHLNLHDPDVVPLSALPWEILYQAATRDFLAIHRGSSIVRFLEVRRPADPLPLGDRLRIAVVMANPPGTEPLALRRELRLIEKAFADRTDIELKILQQTTLEDLRTAVVDQRCHVLHYMGHGEFSQASGEGRLVLHNQEGAAAEVSPETLTAYLQGSSHLRLVVLNACQTAAMTKDPRFDPFGGVAAALVMGGIPAVVAMPQPISDHAAIAFSRTLYRRLAHGDVLDAAVTEGRLAIRALERHSPEWAIPALFLRIPEERMFEKEPARKRFDQGLDSFREGSFRAAFSHFQAALSVAPDDEDADLYLCLTALSLTPASSLSPTAADELNERLDRLSRSPSDQTATTAKLALAILRHDYYKRKRIKAKGKASAELFRELENYRPTPKQRKDLKGVARSRTVEFLVHLDPPHPKTSQQEEE